ncbi:hypothetical protein Naga_100554g3 [Nannochloropsis gaditana]|uniref:Uncharacterized protein n=1 Tax=Nannochloropsis gaditana TaxID=72520 RepID=W7T8L0_9STRA|nr:hypothetical protein Naga_100554g3 [Nannochloropsis gaditana]
MGRGGGWGVSLFSITSIPYHPHDNSRTGWHLLSPPFWTPSLWWGVLVPVRRDASRVSPNGGYTSGLHGESGQREREEQPCACRIVVTIQRNQMASNLSSTVHTCLRRPACHHLSKCPDHKDARKTPSLHANNNLPFHQGLNLGTLVPFLVRISRRHARALTASSG